MPSIKKNRSRDPRLAMPLAFVVACFVWSVQAGGQENDGSDSNSHLVDWSSIQQHGNQIAVEQVDGVIAIRTRGTDPYFHFSIPPLDQSGRDWILQWQYFCPQGIGALELRVGRGIGNPQGIDLPPMPAAEGWTSYAINLSDLAPDARWHRSATRARIDLGRRDGVRIRIRDVIVRPITGDELEKQKHARQTRQKKSELAQSILRYRTGSWPAIINRIERIQNRWRLSGWGDLSKLTGEIHVVTRLPHRVSAETLNASEIRSARAVRMDPDSGEITALIQIDDPSSAELLVHRLQLVQIVDQVYRPISAAMYVEVDSLADRKPPKRLQAAKGLTGITPRLTPDHLRQLGIQHASVNLVISGLVSPTERPGWTKQTIFLRDWWVNQDRLKHYDRNVRIACDAGAVVAGIILIPTSAKQRHPLAHPESSTAGTYAMPDLTTQDSVERYAATISVLAERYGGGHPKFGRIDHWIAHNEVDYGWQWTNMGNQPMEVFLDHYVRSMRLIDAMTRRFNPHARVFISLTHRWNTPDSRPWQTYAPKAFAVGIDSVE